MSFQKPAEHYGILLYADFILPLKPRVNGFRDGRSIYAFYAVLAIETFPPTSWQRRHDGRGRAVLFSKRKKTVRQLIAAIKFRHLPSHVPAETCCSIEEPQSNPSFDRQSRRRRIRRPPLSVLIEKTSERIASKWFTTTTGRDDRPPGCAVSTTVRPYSTPTSPRDRHQISYVRNAQAQSPLGQ